MQWAWPGNTVWESQLMALLPWLWTFRCVEVLEWPPNALLLNTKSHWWLRIQCLCLMKLWTMYSKWWTSLNGVPRTTAAFQICGKTLVRSMWWLIWVFADMFNHINTLNVSVQGKGHNTFEQSYKMYTSKERSHSVYQKMDRTCFQMLVFVAAQKNDF